jgi:probable phosphoglycerate mutase
MSGTATEVPLTRLILIRHGESRVTVDRVIGGPRTCTGLSDLGRQQAERLRDRLATTGEIEATALFASSYPRAAETAEIIAPVLGVPVVEEPGFGEHDPGPDCDGLTFNDFLERYGMPDWESDPHAVTFPGGETVAEFHHRVGATLSRVVRDHLGGAIVVACHGGVIDAAFRALLRLPTHGAFELQTTNTSLTEFVTTRRDRWRLVRYNDAAHIADLPDETPRAS